MSVLFFLIITLPYAGISGAEVTLTKLQTKHIVGLYWLDSAWGTPAKDRVYKHHALVQWRLSWLKISCCHEDRSSLKFKIDRTSGRLVLAGYSMERG